MSNVDISRWRSLIRKFRTKRVAVLGDLMLDKYIWGRVSRISPEAPIPVVEVTRDTSRLGGAGNVYQNILALGGSALLVGMVGRDKEGSWIRKKVADPSGIIITSTRPTTVKTRIIAHQQQLVRVDQERREPIPSLIEKKILRILGEGGFDGILISDYDKGLITETLLRRVLPQAEKHGIPVFADPKVEHFFAFSPVTLITPNHVEAEKAVRQECSSDEGVEKAGRAILSAVAAKYLILKRGERGLSVFERGKRAVHIPAVAREVFDVTGAGDTVLAAASLALLAGATIREAAYLANAAAGVVVGKLGTASLSPSELLAAL